MSGQPLDRNARWALALAILVVIVALVSPLRGFFGRLEHSVPGQDVKDVRQVEVGSDMKILSPDSLEREAADWIKLSDERTFDFELGSQTFKPGSAQLSATGEERLNWFAGLMKRNPSLRLQILLPQEVVAPDTPELQKQQAEQLRNEVIGEGVEPLRVSIANREAVQPSSNGSHIVIFVSR
jgi:hypothetical protein